jgi:hypothetical protein
LAATRYRPNHAPSVIYHAAPTAWEYALTDALVLLLMNASHPGGRRDDADRAYVDRSDPFTRR